MSDLKKSNKLLCKHYVLLLLLLRVAGLLGIAPPDIASLIGIAMTGFFMLQTV